MKILKGVMNPRESLTNKYRNESSTLGIPTYAKLVQNELCISAIAFGIN